ncbi:transcription factor BHLH148-like [Typha angustifolia]|uniref:transcription factor BHLH148-like n=1 Tax=Typha angustifolia TaxID=59011 RepID=UPI003C2E8F0A
MLMDSFYSYQDELFHGDMPMWAFSPEVPLDFIPAIPDLPAAKEEAMLRGSAFEKYIKPEFGQTTECSSSGLGRGSGPNNIHRRVIELLRKIPRTPEDSRGVEGSRGFRHMMRERQRREKLSQSYADLYSMLSSRSKGDKNSIVQSAAVYVRELKGVRDELRRHNEELKARILGSGAQCPEGVKIKFQVANPPSAIDSMIAALRCLKSMDVTARSIQSDFSCHELSASMSIETKMAAGEVERTVKEALKDVQTKKSRFFLPGSNALPQNRHAGNVI